jgi:hypothetical protein
MDTFDYSVPATLFMASRRRRAPVQRLHFASAAEAIRHAIEQIPPPVRSAVMLEIGRRRYDAGEIQQLYERCHHLPDRR